MRFTTDSSQQVLEAYLNAGIGGRDDTALEAGWDSRPTEHVRTNKDLPAADPFDDEVREVLPSLAAAQRADPFFGPVIAYLEVAETNQQRRGCGNGFLPTRRQARSRRPRPSARRRSWT